MSKGHKIVLLGDTECGKSSLIKRYATNVFTQDYTTTVFDSVEANIIARNKQQVKLNIWDVSGSSEFDHVRSLCFSDAVLFIICFDLNNEDSLRNVRNKWINEVRLRHGNRPVILCGCKSDLLEGKNKYSKIRKRSLELGVSTAKEIGAVSYTECSSQTNQERIEELFKNVASIAIGHVTKPRLQRQSSKTVSHVTRAKCLTLLRGVFK